MSRTKDGTAKLAQPNHRRSLERCLCRFRLIEILIEDAEEHKRVGDGEEVGPLSDSLVKSASTALNSKVVSQYSTVLAPLAVDAVLSVVDPAKPEIVDLRDIKIVKKLGETVDGV